MVCVAFFYFLGFDDIHCYVNTCCNMDIDENLHV